MKKHTPAKIGKHRQESSNTIHLRDRQLRAARWHFANSGFKMCEFANHSGVSVRHLQTLFGPKTSFISTSWTVLAKVAKGFGLPTVGHLLGIPDAGNSRASEGSLPGFMESVAAGGIQALKSLSIPRIVKLEELSQFSWTIRDTVSKCLIAASASARSEGDEDKRYYASLFAAKCHLGLDTSTKAIKCSEPLAPVLCLTEALTALKNCYVPTSPEELFLIMERIKDTGYTLPTWPMAHFNAEIGMLRHTEGMEDAEEFCTRSQNLFKEALKTPSSEATSEQVERMSLYNNRLAGEIRGEMHNDYAGGREDIRRQRNILLDMGIFHGAAGALVVEAMVCVAHQKLPEAQALLDDHEQYLPSGSERTQVAADCIRGYCRTKQRKAKDAEPFLIRAYKRIREHNLWMPLGGLNVPEDLFRPDIHLGASHPALQDGMLRQFDRQVVSAQLLQRVMKKWAN